MKIRTLAFVLACGATASSFALNFNFTDTGNSQANAAFAAAGARWSAIFNDNITINVHSGFASLGSGILGSTGSNFTSKSYSSFRSALDADKTSADDNTAVSNLETGSSYSYYTNYTSNNPNGSGSFTAYQKTGTSVEMTTANAKALGLFTGQASDTDAGITFSSNFSWDFDPSDGITSGTYDFVGIAAHEIGHALGFISNVDDLDNTNGGSSDGSFKLEPLDMFRYSAVGNGNNRSFMAGGIAAQFSIDNGATMGANFSTGVRHGDGRQASHWKDNLGLGIMDPTAGSGELLSISQNDIRAFDSIGYNLASVPEPTSMVMLGLGLAGLAARKRRKSQ